MANRTSRLQRNTKTGMIVPPNRLAVGARSIPWQAVLNYLADLADDKLNPADFAKKVHTLYDLLAKENGDAEMARKFLLYQVSAQLHRGLISKQHRGLVAKLLPKPAPPGQGRGRTKGALGKASNTKRYKLYQDWIYEKTLNPSLTKERFAKQRLGITDKDLKGEHSSVHRPKVDALLQDLKPARMKHLGEDQRRALELVYPHVLMYPKYLARKWREAKQQSPALTKQDFLREFFGWPRGRKQHAIEADMIREYLEKLDHGEKLLTNSESR
jgi:hypothetical protein